MVDTASSQAAVSSCYDSDWTETPEAIHGVSSTVEPRVGGADFFRIAVLVSASRHFCLYNSSFIELRYIVLR